MNENLVSHYLQKRGWTILYKNKHVFGVEIDLIARNKTSHILVEVKSLNQEFLLEKILPAKQKRRLKLVFSMLVEEWPTHGYLILATVDKRQKITFYQLTGE